MEKGHSLKDFGSRRMAGCFITESRVARFKKGPGSGSFIIRVTAKRKFAGLTYDVRVLVVRSWKKNVDRYRSERKTYVLPLLH